VVVESPLIGDTSSPFALGAAPSDMLPFRSCWGGNSGGSESSRSGLLSSAMAMMLLVREELVVLIAFDRRQRLKPVSGQWLTGLGCHGVVVVFAGIPSPREAFRLDKRFSSSPSFSLIPSHFTL
jgi:hypothetical protein